MKNTKHFIAIILVSLFIISVFSPFGIAAKADTGQANTQKIESSFLEKVNNSNDYFDIIVKLKNTPLARYYNKSKSNFIMSTVKNVSEALDTKKIEAQQNEFLNFVGAELSNCEILGSTSVSSNNVFLRVKGNEIPLLLASDSVAYIYPSNTYKPLDDYSEKAIGMNSSAWSSINSSGKYNGSGLKYGVIDTGVDYTHPDLGGDGTTRTFPNSKVVGGFDFADNDADPYPDLVSYGHGTHVAGIIAADGKVDGIAPKATIYAYKVFSSKTDAGASDITIIMAIDQAIKDGCDVINMSLGTGDGKALNAETDSINNATLAGIVVVAAAGNSGPKTDQTEFPIGAPSTTLNAISVASSNDSLYLNLKINSPSGDNTVMEAEYFDVSPKYEMGKTYSVVDCGYGSVAEVQSANVSGKIALIQRGPLGDGAIYYRDKVINAMNGGAVGTIIYNHSPGAINATLIVSAETDYDLKFIPSILVTQGNGLYLKNLAKNGLKISLSANSNKGTISEFSSMGVTSDFEFKPDVSAPGSDIYSTYMGDTNKYASLSGTSMASPCVAAVAGLMKKAHPGWTPENIRLALANTSAVLVNPANSEVITWALQGAGRIDVVDAFKTDTLVYTQKGDSTFKYSGMLGRLSDAGIFSQNVFISNAGTVSHTYNISFNWTSKFNDGSNFSLSSNSLTVGANSTGSFNVSFTNQSKKNTSYEGIINITGGTVNLHIPVIIWNGDVKINKLVDNVSVEKTVFNPAVDKTNKISFSLGYGTVDNNNGEYTASNLVPDTVIRIYDSTGMKLLGTIYDKEMLFMGDYEFNWDGTDTTGKWFLTDGDYQLRVSVLKGNNDTKNLQIVEKDYAIVPIKISGTLNSTVFVYPTINGTPKTNWFTVINVNVSSNISISGISGEISIDRNILKYNKVVKGELISNSSSTKLTTSFDDAMGTLKFNVTGKITGVGTLFSIKVDVVGMGTINSVINNLDVRNAFGIGMPFGTNSESINTITGTMDWDVNSDRIIDVKDMLIIAKSYGTSIGNSNYCAEADLNKDGSINSSDFSKMTKYFGQVYP